MELTPIKIQYNPPTQSRGGRLGNKIFEMNDPQGGAGLHKTSIPSVEKKSNKINILNLSRN